MQLVFGRDAAVADWVAARIPHVGTGETFGPLAAIGVAREGCMVAGVVYHNYLAGYQTGEVSFAADTPRWATRGVVRALLAVPFGQYGWRRLSAVIRHDNEPAARLLSGLGFKREGTAREFFAPRVHGVVFGMLAKEHAALVKRFGKEAHHGQG